MGFIDIFNYKKYFKVKSDSTVARIGHVNAVYNALQSGLIGPTGPQGPAGDPGPAGPAVPSGLDWQGAYSNTTAYALNDVVTWTNPDTGILGSYWVTDSAGVTGVEPTDINGNINTGWAFLASQGPQGNQGNTGPTGATVSRSSRPFWINSI